MADKVWVFDLDDTLMETSPIYIGVAKKAFRHITRCLKKQLGYIPFTASQLRNKHLEIDSGLRTKINPLTKKPYHYSMQRFPLSFVETYRFFCRESGIEPETVIEQELFEIGFGIRLTIEEYEKLIKRETKKILLFLQKQGDVMMLLTKGDKRIQSKKLRAFERRGLLKFFARIRTVSDKNQRVFRAFKKGFEGKRFFSVGNEYRADIEPAVKVGYFGIYIPSSHVVPWEKGKLKRIEKERDKANTNKYGNLLEIKEKYEYLR